MKTKVFFLSALLILTISSIIQAQQSSNNQVLISYPDYDLELVGFKDSISGKIVIPAKYSYSEYFFEDYAAINMGCTWGNAFYDSEFQGGKWGYIDKSGKIVIPVIYENAYRFLNNKAEVKLNGETFFINKKGERVK